MVEKNTVYEESVKSKGYFSYTDLYNFCYNWFKDEGYRLSEDEYTEKVSSFGKEVVIKWKAFKKVTDYFKFNIEVKWHILGMTEVEVEVDGKKQKTNKGEVKLKIEAYIEKDYESNWEKTPFWKTMRGIYDKYIIRTTYDEYEDRLIRKTLAFVEDTKAFLNLEGKR